MSVQALMQEALQAQHARSRTYHAWQQALQELVSGSLAVAAFQRCMEQDIVPGFQAASTTLRELQGKLGAQADEHNENKATAYLDDWIDQLQRIEKEHYAVSVAMAKAMAAHCVPPLTHTEPTSSSSSSSSPTCESCVHDRQRCMLYQLLAPQAHGVLCFVVCPTSAYAIGDEDSDEDEEEGGNEEEQGRAQGMKRSVVQHTWASAEGEQERTYVYDPAVVQRRCALWSAEVLPLVERRRQLERQARELTDELQCELTDTYSS